jgi:hypothetical protein
MFQMTVIFRWRTIQFVAMFLHVELTWYLSCLPGQASSQCAYSNTIFRAGTRVAVLLPGGSRCAGVCPETISSYNHSDKQKKLFLSLSSNIYIKCKFTCSSLLSATDFIQNIQRHYEIYSVPFPAGVLGTHVGVMDRNCTRFSDGQ